LLLFKQIAANVLWLHLIIVAEVINRNASVGQSTLVEAAGEFSACPRALGVNHLQHLNTRIGN
jgi:hypothetical protein